VKFLPKIPYSKNFPSILRFRKNSKKMGLRRVFYGFGGWLQCESDSAHKESKIINPKLVIYVNGKVILQ
jgi:hypothetical protein